MDLSPAQLELVEEARSRARAKRLGRPQLPSESEPESGVVRTVDKLADDR